MNLRYTQFCTSFDERHFANRELSNSVPVMVVNRYYFVDLAKAANPTSIDSASFFGPNKITRAETPRGKSATFTFANTTLAEILKMQLAAK
jgi:hypothetical protein